MQPFFVLIYPNAIQRPQKSLNCKLSGSDTTTMGIQRTGGNDEYSDTLLLAPVPTSVLLAMLGLSAVGIKLRKFA